MSAGNRDGSYFPSLLEPQRRAALYFLPETTAAIDAVTTMEEASQPLLGELTRRGV